MEGRSWQAAILLLALAFTGTTGARADPTPTRQHELIHRLVQDCGSCHGLTLKGGLGPPLLPTALADKPEETLVQVILHGIPETPMPPWAFEIEEAEAAWLVRQMKEGLGDEFRN